VTLVHDLDRLRRHRIRSALIVEKRLI